VMVMACFNPFTPRWMCFNAFSCVCKRFISFCLVHGVHLCIVRWRGGQLERSKPADRIRSDFVLPPFPRISLPGSLLAYEDRVGTMASLFFSFCFKIKGDFLTVLF
jgi:hypothetical protein